VTDEPCIFCTPAPEEVLFASDHWYARADKYPVADGHILLIPFRHAPTFFDLSDEEKASFFPFVDRARQWLEDRYRPDGYNVGANVGEAAGQAIMHCHVHMIPRRFGNGEDEGWRGGMRRVIPSGDYRDHMRSESDRKTGISR
jgi:diadenosine tetraphosphate (Ap4A) HIT family hydrolase